MAETTNAPTFFSTINNEEKGTITVVITNAVSEAVSLDCGDLMGTYENGKLYFVYPDIEMAVKNSSIGTLMKKNGYDLTKATGDENQWNKITQLVIAPTSKLNIADLVVINYLAGVSKTGIYRGETVGNLVDLQLHDGVTFVVEDEALSLYGYYHDDFPLEDNTITETFLRAGAFAHTSLESILLPSSITKIGAYAFMYSDLKSIDLLHCKNLTDLGHQCFDNCKSMKTAYLPESLERIYGALFYADEAMKEIYVTSKNVLEEKSGNSDNFTGCQNGEIFIRLSLFNEYKNNGPDNIWCFSDSFYPLIEKGKEWRTFSFDKDLDFSTVKGLYNEGNTLKAYYVSAFNPKDLSTTLTEGSALISNTGVLLYGEGGGAEGELYSIHGTDKAFDPNGTPRIGNYLIAAVEGKNDIKQTENTYETNFLLHDGEFHLCDANGGSVDPYKAYLHIPVPLIAFTFTSSNPAKLSLGTGNGNTTSISVTGLDTAEETDATYTLQGVRMPAKMTLPKGIYISNGKKFIKK